MTVKLADRRVLTATVVGSDKQYDVALLKIDAGNLLRILQISGLAAGDGIFLSGFYFA